MPQALCPFSVLQGEAGVEIPLEVDRDGEILDILIASVARADMLKQPQIH